MLDVALTFLYGIGGIIAFGLLFTLIACFHGLIEDIIGFLIIAGIIYAIGYNLRF